MSILQEMMENVPKEHRWGAALGHFFNSLEGIRKNTDAGGRIPVDMYASDPVGNPSGVTVLTPPKVVDIPIVIDFILATWTSTLGNTPNNGNALTRYNTVTAPAANATLASITIPAGTPTGLWDISAFLSFNGSGATNGVDSNNVQIEINGNAVATVNTNVTAVNGNSFPLTEYGQFQLHAGDVVSLNAIGAGGAAVIYQVNLAISPVPNSSAEPTSVVLTIGKRVITLNPNAGIFTADTMMQFDNWDDPINLTVTPGGPCHLEIMGHGDRRVIDK